MNGLRNRVFGGVVLMWVLLVAGCDGGEDPVDGAAPDAAEPDAAMLDAASVDAGARDGGERDGGADAGPTGAPCVSDDECADEEYCDLSVERCAPDVCDQTDDRPFCDGLLVRRCRANGRAIDDLRMCNGGTLCVTLDADPWADCRCVQDGALACESPLLGADVYEVDSCGNQVRRVTDCVVGRRESCVTDERGTFCTAPETCTTSADCANADYCLDGRCVPDVCTPPPISNPRSRYFCDGNTVMVCAADGSGYVPVEACGESTPGEVCVTLAGDPGADCRCQAVGVACHMTDRWFYDSCGVYTSRLESCDGSEECVDGPAGPSCEVRVTCTRDADCTGVGFCDGGVCVRPVCTPGAERCDGARAQRCDARGSAWFTIDDCVGGETCAVAAGAATCSCAPNAYTDCSGGDVHQFDACGARGARVTDCTGSETCVRTASGAVCRDPSTPATSCLGDDDCGSGEVCLDGACASRVCTPGASFCEAGAARRCDARGAGSALVDDCDGGQQCSVESGEARCTCVRDARLGCSDGNVYSYDSCGGRGSIYATCTSGCAEVGGSASCVAPPPGGDPGPTCTARASQGCYLGDLWWLDSCGELDELAEDCPGAVTCNTIGGPADCRSSVADEASPYWSRSCPLVQDIELQTALPADCRCFVNRTPSGGIDRCTGALYVPVETRIGAGPTLRTLPQARYNGGVIVGRELMVGADWSSSSRPDQGLIMAVHLDTGARRIVSGGYDDPSSGFVETGSGPSFARVLDVQGGPGGMLYALSVPATSADLEIVRVDPATGNRTRVWKGRDAAFGQCASGDPARATVTYHARSFAVSASGEFHLAFRGAGYYSEGVGIVRIAADGSSCAFVTRSGAGSLNAYAASDVGGGYDLDRGYYSGLTEHDGALYVLNDVYNALFRVDPATGDRTRVSSASTSWGVVGAGPTNFGGIGRKWLTWDAARSVMWASGLVGYRGLTAVDLTSGDRVEAYCRSSNVEVPWRDTCLGGILEGGYQDEGGFWLDPANGDPILVHEAWGIVRVDLRNGNSMRISM